MRLLVVAGHGKKTSGVMDNGASGHGYNEAERVRTLANRMKALGGDSVILGDQSKKWLDYGLYNSVDKSTFDCAIELHMDSASASAKGGHVIIKSGLSADSYDKALESFIAGYFPGRSNTIVGRSDLGVVNACANRGINFRLLEVCFISNAEDIAKFNNDIDAVARGILAAFGIGSSGATSNTSTTTDSTAAVGKCTGNSVNVRSGPGTGYSVLRQLNKDNLFDILGCEGDWVKVNIVDLVGYVHKDYVSTDIETTAASTTSTTTATDKKVGKCTGNGVRVRQGPGTNYGILRTLDKGNLFDIIGVEGDWTKVNIAGTVGYVSSQYVAVV